MEYQTNEQGRKATPPLPQAIPNRQNAFVIKILILGIIAIGLLIPLAMTSSLIDERQQFAEDASKEVSAKWGEAQTILPPMLSIPYTELEVDGKDTVLVKRRLWVLPASLTAKASIDVQERKRGIYSTPVYTSSLQLSGDWHLGEALAEEEIPMQSYLLKEAELVMAVSDLKGLRDHLTVDVAGRTHQLRPSEEVESVPYYDEDGYVSGYADTQLLNVPIDLRQALEQPLSFSSAFSLNGSRRFSLAPIGGRTELEITSPWQDPSFAGAFLPESSTIGQEGFTAHWNILDYNRGYDSAVTPSDLGKIIQMSPEVQFKQLVSEYSQSERSIKYGVLIILLTYVSIFFVEMALRQLEVNVNLFHYLLVGLALVLFYTLLISMSEVIGFGWAYLVGSVMTIGLITLFFRSILPPGRYFLILAGIISFLYLLVYLLIQMTTYALLAGSLGLFVILALVMYVSSKLIK